jgi:MerR family redox-sensitive transcriptional activator SoxR
MSESPSLWTPSQLAHRSGLSVSALHFYERHGLIRSQRTSGNQRRYARDTLRRLAVIRAAQQFGVPLADIRNALATLPEGRVPTAADWAVLSGRWQADLDRRIAALLKLRDELGQCIQCGCLSLEHCQMLNPGDVVGRTRPGTHRLQIEET